MSVEVAPVALDPASQAEPVAAVDLGNDKEVEQLHAEATGSLATRSSYYYAHTTRGSDTVKFEPPQKIEAGSKPAAGAAGAVAEAAGASKWNTGSYHWEETDLKASFAKVRVHGVIYVCMRPLDKSVLHSARCAVGTPSAQLLGN